MTDDQAKNILFTSFFLCIAIASFDSLKAEHSLPKPRVYLGACMTYGILAFLSPFAPQLAAMFGAGFLLVKIYQHYNASGLDSNASQIGNAIVNQAQASVTAQQEGV